MVIQKSQRTARVKGFNPQGHFTELHGKRIDIYAIDAMRYHIPEGLSPLLRGGFCFSRSNHGQVLGNSMGCGNKKMP
ncbi:MAG: hypothetical protein JRI71_10705 [Deltaproteobacteria bacterium]|nr:hypothetical protein [Deltaproteobacteria bacterium]MBW2077997.1 hypothetical protein [Deltaproteobacteria bacterium]